MKYQENSVTIFWISFWNHCIAKKRSHIPRNSTYKIDTYKIQLEIVHFTSFLIQWSGKGYLSFRDDKTVTGRGDNGYQMYSVLPSNIRLGQVLAGCYLPQLDKFWYQQSPCPITAYNISHYSCVIYRGVFVQEWLYRRGCMKWKKSDGKNMIKGYIRTQNVQNITSFCQEHLKAFSNGKYWKHTLLR